jgi:hypothetical protein
MSHYRVWIPTVQDISSAGVPIDHYPDYRHGLRMPGDLPGPSNTGHVVWNQFAPRAITGGEAHGDFGDVSTPTS